VFPVRYEINVYILFRGKSVFKGLKQRYEHFERHDNTRTPCLQALRRCKPASEPLCCIELRDNPLVTPKDVTALSVCPQGDSGSSLHCRSDDNGKQVLAGVVSWGRGCAVAGEPGIYTDVAFHRKWLLKIISGPLNGSASEREDIEEEIFATKIHVLGSTK
jgi:hypothetical protein